jgi:hypothetical protein
MGKCVWGDKDLYRMAFHLAGKNSQYTAVPHPPRQVVGVASRRAPGAPLEPISADSSRRIGSEPFHHLGMLQLSPDGKRIQFYHRTAAGKLFPMCTLRRARNPTACVPRWITQPVTQPQLLASVADASEMVFPPDAVDTEWYKSHCTGVTGGDTAAGDSGGDGAAGEGGERYESQLPICESGWEGRLPIPLLPVSSIPGFEQLTRWVTYEVWRPLLAAQGHDPDPDPSQWM